MKGSNSTYVARASGVSVVPNHCKNKMTIIGPAANVQVFVNKANGPCPKWGSGTQGPAKDRTSILSFHALVPVIGYKEHADYSVFGYSAEIDTWSVKWGAFDEIIAEQKPRFVTYHFTTAWCIPYRFLEKTSADFPTLTFYISFSEESPSFGRLKVAAGKTTNLEEGDWKKCPAQKEDFENDSEEGYDKEAFDAACEEYYHQCYYGHEEWVNGLYETTYPPGEGPERDPVVDWSWNQLDV